MNTGKIIPIAFPDTFVRYSDERVLNRVFPLVGLGRKKYIKAGHAAMLLIENTTGNVQYFDFGRYVTPKGKGRVRSAVTDVELVIPMKAKITETGEIENIKELLIWLEAHPEKTHGQGRMIASVCHYVDYEKAYKYIIELHSKGSIAYKAFGVAGSNCSRLVTDALIHSVTVPKVIRKLKFNSQFTPSPLGNVKQGALDGPMYHIHNGEIVDYVASIRKENLTNYFDWNIPLDDTSVALEARIGNAQLLEGIGASAYFELEPTSNDNIVIIRRYTASFEKDFEGKFKIKTLGFDSSKPYEFIYDSNCSYCHVQQQGVIYRFDVLL